MPQIQAETATGTQTFEATPGKKLVLAIEDSGIDILHRCGGNARCTTCRVEILEGDPGEMGEAERARLAVEQDLADNIRLSCQIRVASDLKVRVVNQVSVRGMDADHVRWTSSDSRMCMWFCSNTAYCIASGLGVICARKTTE